MAIDFYPGTGPTSATRGSSSESPSSPDPGCCQSDDRHRTLVLTQLDGSTEGFPLTWLYRWQWRKELGHEVLTLTLTEHRSPSTGDTSTASWSTSATTMACTFKSKTNAISVWSKETSSESRPSQSNLTLNSPKTNPADQRSMPFTTKKMPTINSTPLTPTTPKSEQ